MDKKFLLNYPGRIGSQIPLAKDSEITIFESTEDTRCYECDIPMWFVGTPIGKFSDGYHTFDDLYDQRAKILAVAANCEPLHGTVWKSHKHYTEDDPMAVGFFILGFDTPTGIAAFHLENRYWNLFDCLELDFAPNFDGASPKMSINRLLSYIFIDK